MGSERHKELAVVAMCRFPFSQANPVDRQFELSRFCDFGEVLGVRGPCTCTADIGVSASLG